MMAETELLMAANAFSLQPSDQALERLRLAAIAAEGKVHEPYEQLRISAQRIAAAPRHNWKIAQEAVSELLQSAFFKHEQAAAIARQPTQPIICPNCNSLSRSARVCDVCGEEIQAEAAA